MDWHPDDIVEAEKRVRRGIAEYFDKKRPWWRGIARGVSGTGSVQNIAMGHPRRCLLSLIETTYRTGLVHKVADMRTNLLFEACMDFRHALVSADLTRDLAISYGLQRAESDPSTFYGTLTYRWEHNWGLNA